MIIRKETLQSLERGNYINKYFSTFGRSFSEHFLYFIVYFFCPIDADAPCGMILGQSASSVFRPLSSWHSAKPTAHCPTMVCMIKEMKDRFSPFGEG